MGPYAAWHKPPLRWPNKQHSRLHLHYPPLLHRPTNDGRAEHPLHPPHGHLPPRISPPTANAPLPQGRQRLRNFSRSRLHHPQSRNPTRYTWICGLWRLWSDIHLLHAQSLFESAARDGDGDEENADDDAERALVWTSVEWDAVGGCGVGVWRRRGGGRDTEEGEGGEGQGEEAEGTMRYFLYVHSDGSWESEYLDWR